MIFGDLDQATPADLDRIFQALKPMYLEVRDDMEELIRRLEWWNRFIDFCNTPCYKFKVVK